MNIHRHVAWHLTAAFVALAVTIGCQNEPLALPETSVNIPQQFEAGGSEWKKQSSVKPADNVCLATFFAQNKGLAGSPEFEGEPTVFLSGKSDRRFYWLQTSADGGRWRCVEFRKRKFSTTDGSGSPFE